MQILWLTPQWSPEVSTYLRKLDPGFAQVRY